MLRALRQTALGWLFQWRGPETGTIVLTQRRVFILPTAQGLLLALVVLLILVGSTNYDLALGFVLAFLLAAAATQAMLHTFRNLALLRVCAGRCEPVFAGAVAHFHLRLENPSRTARHAVAVSAGRETADYVDVPAGGEADAVIEIAAARRGWLRPGRFTLFTRFPAGLFRAWSYAEPDMRCLVYPAPATPGLPLPAAAAGEGEGGELGQGQEEFAGLRQYRPGDAPRHMAWKAIARDDSLLLTKQFAGRAPAQLWLGWEQLPAGLDTESRLSHLARWVIEAERAALTYGLRLPGVVLAPAAGPAHRDACLRALALHGTETGQS
jgi:uncharacterized protein (DUF58 family)